MKIQWKWTLCADTWLIVHWTLWRGQFNPFQSCWEKTFFASQHHRVFGRHEMKERTYATQLNTYSERNSYQQIIKMIQFQNTIYQLKTKCLSTETILNSENLKMNNNNNKSTKNNRKWCCNKNCTVAHNKLSDFTCNMMHEWVQKRQINDNLLIYWALCIVRVWISLSKNDQLLVKWSGFHEKPKTVFLSIRQNKNQKQSHHRFCCCWIKKRPIDCNNSQTLMHSRSFTCKITNRSQPFT